MKRYSEKIVTLCCFLLVFANIGLASTSFNVYQPYIVAVPGVGDTGGSIILSARTLASFLAMIVVDRYFNVLDMRRGVALACCMTAVGFAGYAAAATMESFPLFVASAFVVGVGYGFGGMAAVTILTSRWYVTDVGTAVGVASVGSGFASIVIPIVAVRVMQDVSLSSSLLMEGALSAAIAFVVFGLVRNRPSDVGMQPHGAQDIASGDNSASEERGEKRGRQKRVRKALPDSPLPITARRALMVAMALVGMVSVGGMAYLSVLLASFGFENMFVAFAISIAGTCLTIAKFATGELFDHVGTERGSIIAFAFLVSGFVLCCTAITGSPIVAIAGAVLLGIGISVGSVGVSVWSLELSGAQHRTRSIRNSQMAYAFGGFLMNTLPGPLKDLTGSYMVSYAFMTACAAAAAIIIVALYHRYRR